MVKIVAIILALVVILTAGYMVVNSVINLFNGYPVSEAFSSSWYNVTHLFGLIKDKVTYDVAYPMTNGHITWEYARAYNP